MGTSERGKVEAAFKVRGGRAAQGREPIASSVATEASRSAGWESGGLSSFCTRTQPLPLGFPPSRHFFSHPSVGFSLHWD